MPADRDFGDKSSFRSLGRLVPKTRVRTVTPHLAEFSEPIANLFTPRSMRRANSLNGDGLVIALHSCMSIGRFYERAWNIVNAIRFFLVKESNAIQ